MLEKENLEKKIEKLVEKRKLINSTNSFQQIFTLWEEIKTGHSECKQEIKDILSNLDSLISSESAELLDDSFNFDAAFNEIKTISEELKTCSLSCFVEKINRMKKLKNLCFQFLEKEKAKVEEVS